MLKQHTYVEIKYINSLGNKHKIQGIPGGEEKQRGGKEGGKINKMSFKAFVSFW